MARTGRPPVLDAEKKAKVLEVVGAGFPIRYAARYVGCDEGTIRHAGQRDPEFYDQVKYAQFKAEYDLVKNIRTASESGKHWRAAAWSLERMFPDRYGPHRRDEITNEHLVQLSRTYLAIVKRRVPEPLREEVVKEMRRASAEMMIGSAVHTVEDEARSGGLPEEFVPPYWYPEDLRAQEECGEEGLAGTPPAAEGAWTNEGVEREEPGSRRQESFASSVSFAALWCSCVLAAPGTGAPQRREEHRGGVPLLGRNSIVSVAENSAVVDAASCRVVLTGDPGMCETRQVAASTSRNRDLIVPTPLAAAEQIPAAPDAAGRVPDVTPPADKVPASGRPAGVPPSTPPPAQQVPGAPDPAEQVALAGAERRRANTPAPPAEQFQAIETARAVAQRRLPPCEGVYANGQAP
jgi:hypothetical protein